MQAQDVLLRLFDNIRLFDIEPVSFECSCSANRMGEALLSLGADELERLFIEQKQVSINCEFCGANYDYDRESFAALIRGQKPAH